MLPGSTIFSVTTPSKGAVMSANDSVVPAASLAARALSTPDTAACARAAAPAARASAARRAPVASSSSCAVAERFALRPAMRSCVARASARAEVAACCSEAAAMAP
jgi:hypothetical protein